MNRRLDLELLAATQNREYRDLRPAVSIRVPNQSRLLMVLPCASQAAPRSQRGFNQTAPPTPAGKAIELSVSWQDTDSSAEPQRMDAPAQFAMCLDLAEDAGKRSGTLPGHGEDQAVIRLRLVQDMLAEDAWRLLDIVQRTIAP